MIQLSEPPQIPVINHLTGEMYFLVPAKALGITPEQISEIVSICQQTDIYNNLFRELFAGVSYSPDHARDWLEQAHKGWDEGTHYVFCVATSNNHLAASCELSGHLPDGVEIGYWASGEHKGIMTNTVMAVLHLAREAGYRSLVASALHHNYSSKAVLKRCGFLEEAEKRNEKYDFFNLSLIAE